LPAARTPDNQALQEYGNEHPLARVDRVRALRMHVQLAAVERWRSVSWRAGGRAEH
jgi:hypothetical protein